MPVVFPTVTFVSDVVNTSGCTETTTRTYRATDPCGNTAVCTQTITRTVDVTPPSITCPATLALGCNATVPAADVTTVTATDACEYPTVTFVGDVTNLAGCTETTTRTYRATDPCGNTAQCTQTITRTVDVTPPSITCPATLALGCNATVPAADVTTVTAS
jgi:ABC-type Fe3+-hydroxamate transport system substrate-binding protein